MSDDLVSVIVPSYNTAAYIGETIKSVQAQTYENWEMIVVDDCSTDETDEVVRPFLSDERIRYLKNPQNSGAAISRNYALREAKGKWIAFLDSDDLWLPEKLEKQLQFMKENDYKFTYTDYRIFTSDKKSTLYVTPPNRVTKRMLYNYCYFSTITVMYDREAIGLIQIADLKKNNDYAMWFEAIKKTPVFYRLPLCLSLCLKREGSISSGSKWKLIKHYYILYRKGLKKGPIVSTILAANNMFWGVIKRFVNKKTESAENKNGNL